MPATRSNPRRQSGAQDTHSLRDVPRIGFDPRGLSADLLVWTRADMGITLNSGNVSGWDNVSTASNDWAQATASDQPPYSQIGLGGRPELQFDGTSDTMTGINLYGSLTAKDEWTAVILTRGWSFGVSGNPWATEGLFGAPSGGGSYYNIGITSQGSGCFGYHVYEASPDEMRIATSGATSLAEGAPAIVVCVSSGSNGFVRVNGLVGAVVTDMAALEAQATTVNIGKGTRDASKVPSYYDGTMSEILTFDGSLRTAEIEELEAWMADRYGVEL